MDPFSTAAGAVGLVAVALQSAKKVFEAVERYKGRDKAMAVLSTELKQLVDILASAKEAAGLDPESLAFLRGPIEHCSSICAEFQTALEAFGSKRSSSMVIKDWARMEFKRGTLRDFIDTLAGYKSTLQIGLGVVVMRTTKQTQAVLNEYNELIQETSYNLDMQLHRIQERLDAVEPVSDVADQHVAVDLNDEKAVTEQCLQICQDAWAVLQRFQQQQPALQQTRASGAAGQTTASTSSATQSDLKDQFQAQILTRNALAEGQARLGETLNRLQEHLVGFLASNNVDREAERARLQEDLDMSKQCLQVCSLASTISNQKIHIIGEVLADDDCDQVVVTTLADLFDVKKVRAKNNSAQLVGSMDNASLQKLSEDRYKSRFGAVPLVSNVSKQDDIVQPATDPSAQTNTGQQETMNRLGREYGEKPSPDEIRQLRMGYTVRSR